MIPYSSGDYHFRQDSDCGRLVRLAVEKREGDSEYGHWEATRCYLPPDDIPKDALILDVGTQEGDSAIFLFEHGYTNLRLIEPDPLMRDNLKHNVEILRSLGCRVDLCLEPLKKEHLIGAAFIKLDCEGCEWELDFVEGGIPWGGELHMKGMKKDENGRYDYYISIGYFKGDGKKHMRQLTADNMTKRNWSFYETP